CPAPRALIAPTTPPTLAAKEAAFATSITGKTDNTTYSRVIKNPETAATRTPQGGFSPRAARGMANITRYVSAQQMMLELFNDWNVSWAPTPRLPSTVNPKVAAPKHNTEPMGVLKRGCKRLSHDGNRWSHPATIGRRIAALQ